MNKSTSPPGQSKRDQSREEEAINSISHGIGLAAAVAGTPLLIVHAVHHGEVGYIVGCSIFATTMILLYFASTLYHAWPQSRLKNLFCVIDHSMIYLLIAGTYTPFTLGVLHGAWGWTMFGLIWGLAALGLMLKVFNKIEHPVISTGLYLVMGWLILIAIKPLYDKIQTTGLLWLLAGGICYTVGVAFFATDGRLRYGHLIWHIFVLGGTISHYFAVWYAI